MVTHTLTIPLPMRARLLPLVLLIVSCCLTGCMSKKDRAQLFYPQAGTSRTATASAMAAAWRKQQILLDDCLNMAFDHLEKDGDAASIAFAGAVLDFAAEIERELPQQPEYFILWMRIGGLAGQSAAVAYNAGDFTSARSLVLAGPKKWQTDKYWEDHPNHDALVARAMFLTGQQAEAIRWLRRHDDLSGPLKEAQDEIMQAGRK